MPYKKKKEYNEYMKEYMRQYREYERILLREAKKQFGWEPPRKRKKKRKR